MGSFKLTTSEQRLHDALAIGQIVDLRTGDERADDPTRGRVWGPDHTIRAEVLGDLLTTSADSTSGTRRKPLRLAGARITGQLHLEAAELVCPVTLANCWFDRPVILAEATAPAIRLPGCHLPGLVADQLVTRGNLELSDEFTATGELRLHGAHIGGALLLLGATLTNPEGFALAASGLTIDQGMACSRGFTVNGGIDLHGAHIGGDLDFAGATLRPRKGLALTATGLTVERSMKCSDGFVATGGIRLQSARIGDQLVFNGATLSDPGGVALNLQGAQIGWLLLRPVVAPVGLVNLVHAHTALLADDPDTWPEALALNGFTYDRLDETRPASAKQRLAWLARNPYQYTPQPYEQLAAVYRQSGREEDARRVAIAKQRRRRLSGELSLPASLWSLLLGGLVGHGYRTWYAGLWLAGWVLAGGLVFAAAHPQHVQAAKPGENPPAFQPVVYALDVLLPVVNLGQETAWVVAGWARWWTWASILAGWVLTTAVVAALSGLLKRDQI